MRFLLDTNVVSELRKNERCDPAVSAWARHELATHGGAVSVLVLGEIRKGIAMLARRDPPAASRLESWLQGLTAGYGDRILPVTSEIAAEWGRMNAVRSLPAVDSLLGATAIVHQLVLASRNTEDLRDTGVTMINPFEFRA
jgi:predicted nucleic acid-binding protein